MEIQFNDKPVNKRQANGHIIYEKGDKFTRVNVSNNENGKIEVDEVVRTNKKFGPNKKEFER